MLHVSFVLLAFVSKKLKTKRKGCGRRAPNTALDASLVHETHTPRGCLAGSCTLGAQPLLRPDFALHTFLFISVYGRKPSFLQGLGQNFLFHKVLPALGNSFLHTLCPSSALGIAASLPLPPPLNHTELFLDWALLLDGQQCSGSRHVVLFSRNPGSAPSAHVTLVGALASLNLCPLL